MSNITILPNGRPYRRVTCDCSHPGMCRNELCSTHSCNYLVGKDKPNHPVPALSRVDINPRGVYLYYVDAEYTAFFGPLYAWRINRD